MDAWLDMWLGPSYLFMLIVVGAFWAVKALFLLFEIRGHVKRIADLLEQDEDEEQPNGGSK
jgi:hypothetical protein